MVSARGYCRAIGSSVHLRALSPSNYLMAHTHGLAGYFVETVRAEETVETPFVDAKDAKDKKRAVSTTIYYLLTAERADNYMHMNLSTVRSLSKVKMEYGRILN